MAETTTPMGRTPCQSHPWTSEHRSLCIAPHAEFRGGRGQEGRKLRVAGRVSPRRSSTGLYDKGQRGYKWGWYL